MTLSVRNEALLGCPNNKQIFRRGWDGPMFECLTALHSKYYYNTTKTTKVNFQNMRKLTINNISEVFTSLIFYANNQTISSTAPQSILLEV